MFKYWSLFLSCESWSKCCEHRSWGLVTFITTLMGCRQTIVVDESNIDFSIIFLLFFNTKFPIFPIFSILSFLFSYFLSIHGAGHPVKSSPLFETKCFCSVYSWAFCRESKQDATLASELSGLFSVSRHKENLPRK